MFSCIPVSLSVEIKRGRREGRFKLYGAHVTVPLYIPLSARNLSSETDMGLSSSPTSGSIWTGYLLPGATL